MLPPLRRNDKSGYTNRRKKELNRRIAALYRISYTTAEILTTFVLSMTQRSNPNPAKRPKP